MPPNLSKSNCIQSDRGYQVKRELISFKKMAGFALDVKICFSYNQFMRTIKKGKVLCPVDFEDISKVSYKDIVQNLLADEDIEKNKPIGICQIDPRTNDRIVYSESRAKRPRPGRSEGSRDEILRSAQNDTSCVSSCIVCTGKITSIIDMAETGEGYTFINKNLFPVLYPETNGIPTDISFSPSVSGHKAVGAHFLQWPSNVHESDFHNMDLNDIHIVMNRLAVFEEKLLHDPDSKMPPTGKDKNSSHYGYVGIIKNVGRLVGGSVTHGHHQIIHTNIKPRKIEDDQRFRKDWKLAFSQYMLTQNPKNLTIKAYNKDIILLVPYFMKRPLDALIIVADTSKSHVHDLTREELFCLGEALHDVTNAIMELMPGLGREIAYNLVFHTGDIGGMYIEVLPYTQEMGGYEHLGIYLCQGVPESTVSYYKGLII
jgi:galactose-1-phosphate uridylyltransferase